MKDFRSVDVQWALAYSWDDLHSLNKSETRVLMFISVRGLRTEPGMAFAWFPFGGQEWWAFSMGMEVGTLRKTLSRLRKKGLLKDLPGSVSDARFRHIKGYGISLDLLKEMRQWSEDKSELSFINTPFVRASLTPTEVLEYTNTDSDEQAKDESEIVNVDSGRDTSTRPVVTQNVTSGHKNVTTGHVSRALTRTFAAHNKNNQRTTKQENPSGSLDGARRAPSERERGQTPMRFEDEWSVPKDELEASRSGSRKPPAKVSPTTRVTRLFEDLWMDGRQERKSLAYPWSTKTVAMARFKALISEMGEQQTTEMVRIFFRLVSHGQVTLKSEELWKDFWFNRAMLERLYREKADAPQERQMTSEENIADLHRRLAGRRGHGKRSSGS